MRIETTLARSSSRRDAEFHQDPILGHTSFLKSGPVGWVLKDIRKATSVAWNGTLRLAVRA